MILKNQRIAITPGEPAGIGPDIVLQIAAQQTFPVEIVAVANPELMAERAKQLDLAIKILPFDLQQPAKPHQPGQLLVWDIALPKPCLAGILEPANAQYVLKTLEIAAENCLKHHFAAMVTGPVHKGIINQAGFTFSGHTEFLAQFCHTKSVVMMLVADTLRVALLTTHLPLREVPQAITTARLSETLQILHHALQQQFHILLPRILVAGLNPHAGEGGHLGHEEIEIITPTLTRLREQGLQLTGPLPADTLFTPQYLQQADAVLCMYHDQGLPVLKYVGFGHAINVTLGLPIIRTSVDHGTALDLAGTGKAQSGSLLAAIKLAVELSQDSST
ncbi:MAG: 4-hydroxythreonine-4-phosphate dehydrogenase PdxA [Gammaproteobacteria bacterium]